MNAMRAPANERETADIKIAALLEHEQEIEAKAQVLARAIGEAQVELMAATGALRDARNGARGFENAKEERDKQLLIQHQENVARCEAARRGIENRLASLRAEQAENSAKLATLHKDISAEDVTALQNMVAQAEEEVNRFHELTQRHQAAKNEAERLSSGLPALQRQREDLLADIADGAASADALAAFDEEIRSVKAQEGKERAKRATIIDEANQMIAGVGRRLAAATQYRDRLLGLHSRCVDLFLVTEAKRLGREYVEHALEAVARLKRLAAIQILVHGRGHQGNLIFAPGHVAEMRLPAIEVLGEEDAPRTTTPGVMFFGSDLAEGSHAVQEALMRERERIEGLGIAGL